MSFIGILILQFFALITPGPDFILVSRTGLTSNKIAIFRVVLGICTSVSIWMILSILGLHILFQTYPVLNKLTMLGGSLYLFYLAYGIVKGSSQDISSEGLKEHNHFIKGIMCNLSNPKAIIYYTSIFSVLPLESGYANIVLMTFCLLVESFFCFVGLGFLFSHPVVKRKYQQYTKKIDIASAFIFTTFAVFMLVECLR